MEIDILNREAAIPGTSHDKYIRHHEWAILNDHGFDGYERLRSNVKLLRNTYPNIIRNRL